MVDVLFSVIIPTCNRNEDLSRCLELLAPGSQEGMVLIGQNEHQAEILEKDNNDQKLFDYPTYEVIISDDGSESNAEKLIHEKYPWAKWLKGPCQGPAANRNNGASIAKGKWIVFTDDDCLPQSAWLSAYRLGILEHVRISVLEGRTITPPGIEQKLGETAPVNETGGFLWTCNFAIERTLFEQMRGFDEDFPYAAMEDIEFHLRLKKAGIEIKFMADAEIIHPWKSVDRFQAQRKNLISRAILVCKHPDQKHLFSIKKQLEDFARYELKTQFRDISKFGPIILFRMPIRLFFLLQSILFIFRRLKYVSDRSVKKLG